MRAQARAIVAEQRPRWRELEQQPEALADALSAITKGQEELVSVTLIDGDTEVRSRTAPARDEGYRPFTVRLPLQVGSAEEAQAVFVFAADTSLVSRMNEAQRFAQAYRQMQDEQRARFIERPYMLVFVLLLGATVLLAIFSGIFVVRPVTRRLTQLAEATRPVAAGDLSVRVYAKGDDEIAALGRAFNQMLERLELSRTRIEFLKRIGQWQTMARRLAHEIKNPLTPIQLAVEECHQRYDRSDEGFGELLDTMREIVDEEVASLRRLVTEFSSFARLPNADLQAADLGEFLREQMPRLQSEQVMQGVSLQLDVCDGEVPVELDRTMFYRALVNLTGNAAQAARQAGGQRVNVNVTRQDGAMRLRVEDDGQGVSEQMQAQIFEPYVTGKADGTGLGLTIVKKIILDHGGTIHVSRSKQLGGACFELTIPARGTDASAIALTQSAEAAIKA